MEFLGCGDNSCAVVKPKGMATNGGCRCHKDTTSARRAIAYLSAKVRELECTANQQLKTEIASVVKEYEEMSCCKSTTSEYLINKLRQLSTEM